MLMATETDERTLDQGVENDLILNLDSNATDNAVIDIGGPVKDAGSPLAESRNLVINISDAGNNAVLNCRLVLHAPVSNFLISNLRKHTKDFKLLVINLDGHDCLSPLGLCLPLPG